MVLFELIKRCLDSGYELTFRKELGMIHIKVISKNNRYDDTKFYDPNEDGWKHQCEQIIPNDNHLYRMNEVILFCIDKVDELVAQHRKLIKQDNG